MSSGTCFAHRSLPPTNASELSMRKKYCHTRSVVPDFKKNLPNSFTRCALEASLSRHHFSRKGTCFTHQSLGPRFLEPVRGACHGHQSVHCGGRSWVHQNARDSPRPTGTTLDPLGQPWTRWDNPGPTGTTLDCPWTHWDNPGPTRTTLDPLGQPWIHWDSPGPTGTALDPLGQPWIHWDSPGPTGTALVHDALCVPHVSDVDNCDPNPCGPGQCVNLPNNMFTCNCAEGSAGDRCQEREFRGVQAWSAFQCMRCHHHVDGTHNHFIDVELLKWYRQQNGVTLDHCIRNFVCVKNQLPSTGFFTQAGQRQNF